MFTKDIHYNLSIEDAVLGGCMLEPEAFGRIYGMLQPDYFYHPEGNGFVFQCMVEMFQEHRPIDYLTVTDYLMRVKGMAEINGTNTGYYCSRLTNQVTGTHHLPTWCGILYEMYIDRQIIGLQHGGWKVEGEDPMQQMESIAQQLQELRMRTQPRDFVSMNDATLQLLIHQEKMRQRKGQGLTTSIKMLDRTNGGFFPGEFCIIAARPGVGKSAFAAQMAVSMARKGSRVGFISLEMNITAIAARIAAIDTQTDFKVLYRGLYNEQQEMEAVYNKLRSSTVNLPIFISDKTGVNILDIKAKAMKLKKEHGCDVIFLDYLQLTEPVKGSKNATRENEVSQISRGCKLTAMELQLPFIALSQLSRAVTARTGEARYPRLSDLRESGSLEQDADQVMFLHSDFKIEKPDAREDEYDLLVEKWRNEQAQLRIPLKWYGSQMRFEEAAQFHAAPAGLPAGNWQPVDTQD